MAFSDDKALVFLYVNHLSIPLLAMWELLTIIEGYVTRSTLEDYMIIESDSLLALKSLNCNDEDFSEMGALSFDFCNNIDFSFTSFSHVYRSGNPPHTF